MGGAVQLACVQPGAPFGSPFRLHLRLFRSREHTLGGAHLEFLIPGTAEHEVLSWDLAREFVSFDMARTGLLTAAPSAVELIPAGAFRAVRLPVYLGLAQAGAGSDRIEPPVSPRKTRAGVRLMTEGQERASTEASLRRAERMTAILVLVAGGVGAWPARATCVEESGEGPSVRVTTRQGQLAGRLVAVRDDAIDLLQAEKGKSQTRQVSRAEILGLEVSQRPSRKRRGLALGAVAGLGAALAIGAGRCGSSRSAASCVVGATTCNDTVIHSDCVALVALSGLLTVPLGGLLGHGIAPGEKWGPADLTTLKVQPAVSRGGGLGIRIALGF